MKTAKIHKTTKIQEYYLYDDCKRRYYIKGRKIILGFDAPYMILEIMYGFLTWKDNPTTQSCSTYSSYHPHSDNIVGTDDSYPSFTFNFRVSLKNIANEEILNEVIQFKKEFYVSEDSAGPSNYFSLEFWGQVAHVVENELNPYLLTILPFINGEKNE